MTTTRDPAPRRTSLLRSVVVAAGLVAFALAGAGCDEEPETPAREPLAGSRPELERWVVHLKSAPPDPAPYHEALKASPEKAAEEAEKLREQAIRARTDFTQRLKDLGGQVVDHWWLTSAVTVEIPSGNVPTLKLLDEVERIAPDHLLDE